MKRTIEAFFATAMIVGLLVFSTGSTFAAKEEKVTICHAAGQAGTTKFVTLTIARQAVYGANGNAGHFSENGTPRAGHEEDYFGPCRVSEPTPPPPNNPPGGGDTGGGDTGSTGGTRSLPATDMASDVANLSGHPSGWVLFMVFIVGLAVAWNRIADRIKR